MPNRQEQTQEQGQAQAHTENGNGAYVVSLRGVDIKCATIDQVVEAVNALSEREVAVPQTSEPQAASDLARAVYALYREEPKPRRPIEIIKALRKRGERSATYQRVYAVLRYGDFVRHNGRWNLTDAA